MTGNLTLNDSVVLGLGTGNDVKHHFNGTSYITELEGVNWTVRDVNDSSIMTVTESTKAVQFGGAVVIDGDLTVSGTTTTVNTETINLADNIITLNSNVTGTPTENSGIEVERGTATNATLRWNETDDIWEIDFGDGVFSPIVREAELTTTLSDYVLYTDVDDVPVDGATTAPISSNWAFDHSNAADPHSVYPLQAGTETITGTWDFTNATFDGGTF